MERKGTENGVLSAGFLATVCILAAAVMISACSASHKGGITLDAVRNATYVVEGEKVTLVDGKSEQPIPDSSAKNMTEATKHISIGKAAAVVLRQTAGGTGTFYYIAAVTNVAGTNAVFIGDRISINDVSSKDGVVTVKYLDRPEGTPMSSAPTVEKTKKYKLNGNTLTEIK